MKELGIYIHIPFCKQKCFYCDFLSYSNKYYLLSEYIECIKKEISCSLENETLEDYEITTIYIGGGTPSYVDSRYIKEILNIITEKINIKNIEITIEMNPGTVDIEKMNEYKNMGINRLSIGLQSSNNMLLQQIGRIHTYKEFLNTYNIARQIGFENVNVDLMIGLPNQTLRDVEESIQEIIELSPEHISVYSLIVEEGTCIEKMINEGKMKLPEECVERNMYWHVKDKLEKYGYNHYEISNFAKNGYESKHNVNCWEQKEYLGFGVGAHSYYKNKRFSNDVSIDDYIKNISKGEFEKNIKVHEVQSKEDMKKEFMLLGLRKINGIDIAEFKNKYNENPIYLFRTELNKLVRSGLIEIDLNHIKLTNKGIDLANIVWEEFV